MTVENCKRLLKHYEDNGMTKEAANIKAKLQLKQPAPSSKKKTSK